MTSIWIIRSEYLYPFQTHVHHPLKAGRTLTPTQDFHPLRRAWRPPFRTHRSRSQEIADDKDRSTADGAQDGEIAAAFTISEAEDGDEPRLEALELL